MRKGSALFVAIIAALAIGVAAALAYSHSGPLYDGAYGPQLWNYGTGIGIVSGNSTADSVNVPGIYAGAFEESALRDLGSSLEGEQFTTGPASLAWISTDSYGSLKIATGISNRFFVVSGNLGSPVANSSLQGEALCGDATPLISLWTNPACLGVSYGYNYSSYGQWGLPAGTTGSVNYAALTFQYTSSCSTSLGGFVASDVIINPADIPSAAVGTARATCVQAVWNAYQSFGGTTSGTFTYGAITYSVFHLTGTGAGPGSDCLHAENYAWLGSSLGSSGGTGCYIAYALHPALQSALEHVTPVAFTSQTALQTRTISPSLTTTPVAANLARVRSLIDGMSQSYTDEWNCLLEPGSIYTCPATNNGPGVTGSNCVDVPKPLVGEDYNSYVQRLQDDGFTGSTYRVDDAAWSGYPPTSAAGILAPYTVTGVSVLGGSSYMLYDPTTGNRKSWPSVPPSFCATTVEIDVTTVPSSSTGTGPSSSPGSIDFSPLTSISYGTKFPFGIYSWIDGTLNPTTPSCTGGHLADCGNAPNFTITKPGGGSVFVDFSSHDWEFTYRPIVFGVIEFLMTVAAIWFLAWRVIGIGSGSGDDE